jgi:hypothetical protein
LTLMASRLVFLEPDMAPLLAAHGLRLCEDFVNCGMGELVRESGTTRTRRIQLDEGSGPRAYFLKTYRPDARRGWGLLHRDKAAIEVRNYGLMRDRGGLDVPEVVALGRSTRFGRLVAAFILTRGLDGASPLDAWFDKARPGPAERQALGSLVARLARRMHDVGFAHIDLQWRNLLLVETRGGARRIIVLDCPRGGLRRWPVFREHGRLRDLSSLHKAARGRLTAREQLRWLKDYLCVRRLRPEHRQLVRTILHDRAVKDRGR